MSIVLGSITFWLAVFFGIGILFATFWYDRRLEQLRISELPPSDGRAFPPAAVIMALKGLDSHLRENLVAILEQVHPSLEFVFAVESKDDPAYLFVSNLLDEHRQRQPALKAKLVVAGISHERAQKITNQLAALKVIGEDVEHLVFLDSDILPHQNYLRYLLAPFQDKALGVTTGYRWYQPSRPSFSGILCSAWNAGATMAIAHPLVGFVWGGTMAIRRDMLQKCDISRVWNNTVSDDMSLTNAARSHGFEIRYVPHCVAITHETPSLPEVLEFTSRQMLMAKVYYPLLWWSMSLIHPVLVGIMGYGLVNLLLWLSFGDSRYLAGAGGIALVPFFFLSTLWLIEIGRRWLPEVAISLSERRWSYVLISPLASLLSMHNSIKNLLTHKIVWRGVQYELVSPEKTIVTRPDDLPYRSGSPVSR